MDMKKILQAMDGAKAKAEVNSSDMKKFMQIIEGRGPLNRLTQAETIAVNHYTEEKKTITSPVLNVAEDATPSMIGKYFKTIETELAEAANRNKDRARQLAERVSKKMDQSVSEGSEQYSYRDIAEMARQGLSNEEIAEALGFDLTEGLKDPKDNPCWKGYKPVGTKKKGGRTVPNCVPKESVQKKGPAGQLKAKAKVDVKGTVLGSKEKSQTGLRGKLVGGST